MPVIHRARTHKKEAHRSKRRALRQEKEESFLRAGN